MQAKTIDITDSEIRRNIGSILPYYPITDAERQRISELMRSERLPNYVFTRYASKTDWYKEGFEKRKQIDGFRKGKGGYHKQAIPILIDHLSHPSSPNYQLCWKIYQAAAIKYVQTELPLLDKLLVEVGYDGDENDSSQLLKSICSNAMDYDVTATDVAKFYEVWWLSRVENVDQILSLCAQHDESRVQARAIRKLSLLLDELNKSVVDLTQTFAAHSTRLAQSEAMTEKNNQKLSEQQNSITALKEHLANLSTNFSEGANSIAVFEQRLNKLSEALIPLRQQVHDRVTTQALKTGIKDLREELRSLVDSAHDTQLATLKNETLDFIGDAINEFDQKLANFSADVETTTARTVGSGAARTSSSRYESPLFSGLLDQSRLATKPAQELDFLMSWSRDLSGIGFSHSNEALLAYHLILLASTVTVTSHKLAKSWINSLGWASFQKQIVATPTWSAEEDWASGVEYLFGDKASKEPKVLFIHNYDIGLVDCYLAPTLLHWAVSEARKRDDHKNLLDTVHRGNFAELPNIGSCRVLVTQTIRRCWWSFSQ